MVSYHCTEATWWVQWMLGSMFSAYVGHYLTDNHFHVREHIHIDRGGQNCIFAAAAAGNEFTAGDILGTL